MVIKYIRSNDKKIKGASNIYDCLVSSYHIPGIGWLGNQGMVILLELGRTHSLVELGSINYPLFEKLSLIQSYSLFSTSGSDWKWDLRFSEMETCKCFGVTRGFEEEWNSYLSGLQRDRWHLSLKWWWYCSLVLEWEEWKVNS